MENYKKMYIGLFKAVTSAIRILQEAQKKCEEMYINGEQENTIPVMYIEPEE